jgi:hypothetical protein
MWGYSKDCSRMDDKWGITMLSINIKSRIYENKFTRNRQ